ncbi:hypothetical protein JCM10212_001875 [Sporobolomyces blumeae]
MHTSPESIYWSSTPISSSSSAYSTSPTSGELSTPPRWSPTRTHRSDSTDSNMSLQTPASPYAAMEIPNVEMVRSESAALHDLQAREVEFLGQSLNGAGLDLAVREHDKQEAAKMREALATGGGGGPKT